MLEASNGRGGLFAPLIHPGTFAWAANLETESLSGGSCWIYDEVLRFTILLFPLPLIFSV